MDTVELKHRLGRILAEEEGDGPIDWQRVEQLSNALIGELQMPVPLVVEAYLRGSARRREDMSIGHAQRGELVAFLRSKAEPKL
jgi:hypothetical protein